MMIHDRIYALTAIGLTPGGSTDAVSVTDLYNVSSRLCCDNLQSGKCKRTLRNSLLYVEPEDEGSSIPRNAAINPDDHWAALPTCFPCYANWLSHQNTTPVK